MNQQVVDENMLLSSILNCKAPEAAEKKVKRRRRRRAREEGEEGRKRRLSEEQAKFMEKSFRNERKLESGRKVQLASEAGLEPRQVAVWFQNRRARWKSKQLEGEYIRLKSIHEAALVDNCHLQSEVLKLKQQLLEAQKQIENLSSRLNGLSCGVGGDGGSGEHSSSPSMSYSMDTDTFYGELWPRREEFGFMDEYSAYVNMLDWLNFYGM